MRQPPVRLNSRYILALASVVELALAVGCNGQGALYARDADALRGTGGTTGTGGSTGIGGDTAGTGGIAGSGAGTGGAIAGTGGTATGGSMGGKGGSATGGIGGGSGGQLGTGGVAPGTGGNPGKGNGAGCTVSSECASTYCVDKVCCENACSGTCVACSNTKTGQGDGNCRAVPAGQDPDGDCPTTDMTTCGSTGLGCNGSGQCKKWAAGTICGTTVACNATFSAVVPGKICNGSGTCQDAPSMNCNGFLCSAGACGTSCTDDSACVTGGFCSAGKCVAAPNLAGNGDLETGTILGWSAQNGSGMIEVSSVAVGGFSHGGQYSLVEDGPRTQYYAGPGYNFPTGPGKYDIDVWTRQNEDLNFPGVLQIHMVCATSSRYVQLIPTFSQNMSQNTWTEMKMTVDTSTTSTMGVGTDCLPSMGGVVKSAAIYLNQPDPTNTQANGAPPAPTLFPDLYIDDLVIQVSDQHNLISNSGFESGYTDGWNASATPSALQVTANKKNNGMYSLQLSQRAATTTGIQYQLPLGAARYNVSLYALHTGAVSHPLVILPSYTCAGSSTQKFGPQIALPGSGGPGLVTGGTWVQLTGTVTLPPASETPGCVLSQAALTLQQADTGACSAVECPDLYVDDASLIIPVATP